MSKTIEIALDFEIVTCANCGQPFGILPAYVKARRSDHREFYCPSGHTNYYTAETEAERLKRELASAKGNAKYYREQTARLQRSRSALRGVATRLRNKAKAGECAFCDQAFPDMAQHMAEAHADVDPAKIEESESEE